MPHRLWRRQGIFGLLVVPLEAEAKRHKGSIMGGLTAMEVAHGEAYANDGLEALRCGMLIEIQSQRIGRAQYFKDKERLTLFILAITSVILISVIILAV